MTGQPFGLRSWQFHGNEAKGYLAQVMDRTIAEALRYKITHLEFSTNLLRNSSVYTALPVPPCCNWILCGLNFRHFARLARHDVLHDGTASITRAQREADFLFTRDLFRKVKASGLGVMVWHHLRRDLPDELAREYPASASGDPAFLQEWEEATLTEFFELLPEVDMLVVTSMTETPGVHDMADDSDPVDRLETVFRGIDRACRRAGKTLAIRDWGAVGHSHIEGGHIFHEAFARLPEDICIYIKNVVCDFVTNMEVPHPNLGAYPDRPLIVEFDVYGEYFGRADIPYVDPQHFCGRLDGIYPLEPYGISARISYECDRAGRRYPTIFDSPNAANAVVFARWGADAAENYTPAQWLDITVPAKRWQTYYWEWLSQRYGLRAAPLLAHVFERTPQIIHGIFGGLWTGYWHPYDVLEHTTLPWPPMPLEHHGSVAWKPPGDIAEFTGGLGDNDFKLVTGWLAPGIPVAHIGWCQLVLHKREALRLASLCAQEIVDEGPTVLTQGDMADLDLLFRQLVMICKGDLLTGQIFLAVHGPVEARTQMDVAALETLAGQADEVATEARTAFGEDFFGEFPLRMQTWATWARNVGQARCNGLNGESRK